MNAARFLEQRAPAWDRLEEIVVKAGKSGGHLGEDDLHELTRLYPSVAVDVARARAYGLAGETQKRLNEIAIAANGLLYRRPRSRPLPAVWRFYTRSYPILFRRLWPYWAVAFSVAFIAGLGAYVSTLLRPANAYLFVPSCVALSEGEKLTPEDISERFRAMPRPPMAAGIMANNISVAFNAFALGITACIGTCYVLLFNAFMVGGLAAHFANHGLSYPFWSFILPHGVLEILAILIAGGAGIRLGLSLAVPGRLSRKASLQAGAREALFLVLGTIPMFIVAGAIEAFVTPTYAPGWLKIAVGVLAGAAAWAYLMLVGRGRREATARRAS